MKIFYRDLSIPLKIAYWFAWIIGIIATLEFLGGFLIGLLSR